jgi:beta-glucosidase
MLKNEGHVLPLRGVQDVTLFGGLADTANIGDHGSSSTQPPYVTTMLQGLKAAFGAPFRVQFEEGSDHARAAAAATFCDVAIVVVGYTFRDEGEYLDPGGDGPWTDHFPKTPEPEDEAVARRIAEMTAALGSHMKGIGGDRTTLTLHAEDEALIQAVAAANPRTVVAIMSGSTVIMEAWRDKVAGILLLGYPGQEGGHAFADVLLGHVNPSGNLPFVVPKRAEDLPFFDKDATTITYDLWHGYRKLERDNAAPAFPFGFGLSYTTFNLSDLRLAQDTIATDGSVMATVDITNTCEVAGEEVVQLYVSARNSTVERAPKELKAFTKVALAPGETRTVRLAVPAPSLAYYDEKDGWIVEPRDYEVFLGRHSLDPEALRARFAIRRTG